MDLCKCCKSSHKDIPYSPLAAPPDDWEDDLLSESFIEELGKTSLSWFDDLTEASLETVAEARKDGETLMTDISTGWSPCPRGGVALAKCTAAAAEVTPMTALLGAPGSVSASRTKSRSSSYERLCTSNQDDLSWTSGMATPFDVGMDTSNTDLGASVLSETENMETPRTVCKNGDHSILNEEGQQKSAMTKSKSFNRMLFSPGQRSWSNDSLSRAVDWSVEADLTVEQEEEEKEDTTLCSETVVVTAPSHERTPETKTGQSENKNKSLVDIVDDVTDISGVHEDDTLVEEQGMIVRLKQNGKDFAISSGGFSSDMHKKTTVAVGIDSTNVKDEQNYNLERSLDRECPSNVSNNGRVAINKSFPNADISICSEEDLVANPAAEVGVVDDEEAGSMMGFCDTLSAEDLERLEESSGQIKQGNIERERELCVVSEDVDCATEKVDFETATVGSADGGENGIIHSKKYKFPCGIQACDGKGSDCKFTHMECFEIVPEKKNSSASKEKYSHVESVLSIIFPSQGDLALPQKTFVDQAEMDLFKGVEDKENTWSKHSPFSNVKASQESMTGHNIEFLEQSENNIIDKATHEAKITFGVNGLVCANSSLAVKNSMGTPQSILKHPNTPRTWSRKRVRFSIEGSTKVDHGSQGRDKVDVMISNEGEEEILRESMAEKQEMETNSQEDLLLSSQVEDLASLFPEPKEDRPVQKDINSASAVSVRRDLRSSVDKEHSVAATEIDAVKFNDVEEFVFDEMSPSVSPSFSSQVLTCADQAGHSKSLLDSVMAEIFGSDEEEVCNNIKGSDSPKFHGRDIHDGVMERPGNVYTDKQTATSLDTEVIQKTCCEPASLKDLRELESILNVTESKGIDVSSFDDADDEAMCAAALSVERADPHVNKRETAFKIQTAHSSLSPSTVQACIDASAEITSSTFTAGTSTATAALENCTGLLPHVTNSSQHPGHNITPVVSACSSADKAPAKSEGTEDQVSLEAMSDATNDIGDLQLEKKSFMQGTESHGQTLKPENHVKQATPARSAALLPITKPKRFLYPTSVKVKAAPENPGEKFPITSVPKSSANQVPGTSCLPNQIQEPSSSHHQNVMEQLTAKSRDRPVRFDIISTNVDHTNDLKPTDFASSYLATPDKGSTYTFPTQVRDAECGRKARPAGSIKGTAGKGLLGFAKFSDVFQEVATEDVEQLSYQKPDKLCAEPTHVATSTTYIGTDFWTDSSSLKPDKEEYRKGEHPSNAKLKDSATCADNDLPVNKSLIHEKSDDTTENATNQNNSIGSCVQSQCLSIDLCNHILHNVESAKLHNENRSPVRAEIIDFAAKSAKIGHEIKNLFGEEDFVNVGSFHESMPPIITANQASASSNNCARTVSGKTSGPSLTQLKNRKSVSERAERGLPFKCTTSCPAPAFSNGDYQPFVAHPENTGKLQLTACTAETLNDTKQVPSSVWDDEEIGHMSLPVATDELEEFALKKSSDQNVGNSNSCSSLLKSVLKKGEKSGDCQKSSLTLNSSLGLPNQTTSHKLDDYDIWGIPERNGSKRANNLESLMLSVSEISTTSAGSLSVFTEPQHLEKSMCGKSGNKNCLVKDGLERPKFAGFSTASGVSVSVSARALNHAKSILDDSGPERGETNVKKQPKNNLGTPNFSGFSTAKGMPVSVSEKALTHAKTVFDEDSQRDDLPNHKFPAFYAASAASVSVSENAFNHAKADFDVAEKENKNINIHKKQNTEQLNLNLPGFSTASGASVIISENALSLAKTIFENTECMREETDLKLEQKTELLKPKLSGFSTASGTCVSVSEKALSHAKTMFCDTGNDNERIVMVQQSEWCKPKFSGSSTVKGVPVSVSKKALHHDKNKYENPRTEREEIDVKGQQRNALPSPKFSPGFATASVSEKALSHANTIPDDSELEREQTNIIRQPMDNLITPKFSGFSTASGASVSVSEKALNHAKTIFDDSELERGEINVKRQPMNNLVTPKFSVFSTASGASVSVSEKALTHAKTIFDGDIKGAEIRHIVTREEPQRPKFAAFSTASGTSISVSEHALQLAKMEFDTAENQEMCIQVGRKKNGDSKLSKSFSTASGLPVCVSEKALCQAKTIFDGEQEIAESGMVKQPKGKSPGHKLSKGFSTASGQPVCVSEKALCQAKTIFDNCDGEQEIVETGIVNQPKRKSPGHTSTEWPTEADDSVRVAGKSSQQMVNVLENGYTGPVKEARQENMSGCDTAHSTEHKLTVASVTSSMSASTLSMDMSVSAKGVSAGDRTKVLARPFLTPQRTSCDNFHYDRHDLKLKRLGVLKAKSLRTESKLALSIPSPSTNSAPSSFKPPYKKQKIDTSEPCQTGGSRKTRAGSSSFIPPPTVKTSSTKAPTSLSSSAEFEATQVYSKTEEEEDKTATELVFNPLKAIKVVSSPRLGNDEDDGSNNVNNTRTLLATSCGADLMKGERKGIKNGGGGDAANFGCELDDEAENELLCREEDNKGCEVCPDSAEVSTPSGDIFRRRPSQSKDDKRSGASISEHCSKTCVENENSGFGKENTVCDIETKSEESRSGEKLPVTDLEEEGSHEVAEDDGRIPALELEEAHMAQDKLIRAKRRRKVRPSRGRWFMARQGSKASLLKLASLVLCPAQLQGQSRRRDEHLSLGVSPSILRVNSLNAKDFRFDLQRFYPSAPSCSVLLGDGAMLVPDQHGKAGALEIYRAFLTLDGVDPALCEENWVRNHLRWIVWKLAAYEVCYPHLFAGRALTPDNVLLQLKYRYDREIDACHRSAIKKIVERDDAPNKRMILCVAAVHRSPNTKPSTMEVTDGWYSIQAQLDGVLSDLVTETKLRPGIKFITSGAELIGTNEACNPLEIPESLMLKLNGNSTRPAPAHAKLGYCSDPSPLCIPMCSLNPRGGVVGSVDVVLARKYSTMFMEKLSDGSCMFRTGEEEEKERRRHEERRQEQVERLYSSMEKAKDDKASLRGVRRSRRLNKREIQNLWSGQELAEAMDNSLNPEDFQQCLSSSQMERLSDFKRSEADQKQQELSRKLLEAMAEAGNETRKVTPVQKFKVYGCCRADIDKQMGCPVTIWRPSSDWADIVEGRRYRLYNMAVGSGRSKDRCHVTLTGTRQSRLQEKPISDNLLDLVYEKRESWTVCDLTIRQPKGQEFDFVGMVVRVNPPNSSVSPTILYLLDVNQDFLSLKVWPGKQGQECSLKPRQVVCASSLFLRHASTYNKGPYSRRLVNAETQAELSTFSTSSHTSRHSQQFAHMERLAKSPDFLAEAEDRLEQLLSSVRITATAATRTATVSAARTISTSVLRPAPDASLDMWQNNDEDFPPEIIEKIFSAMSQGSPVESSRTSRCVGASVSASDQVSSIAAVDTNLHNATQLSDSLDVLPLRNLEPTNSSCESHLEADNKIVSAMSCVGESSGTSPISGKASGVDNGEKEGHASSLPDRTLSNPSNTVNGRKRRLPSPDKSSHKFSVTDRPDQSQPGGTLSSADPSPSMHHNLSLVDHVCSDSLKRRKLMLREKMSKLLAYDRPSPLSPLPQDISPASKKDFKSPLIKKT